MKCPPTLLLMLLNSEFENIRVSKLESIDQEFNDKCKMLKCEKTFKNPLIVSE